MACRSIDKQTPWPPCAPSFTMSSLTCLCPPDTTDLNDAYHSTQLAIHWPMSQVRCMGESTVKSKRNKFILVLTGTLVLVSFWLIFYFSYIIKTFKECRLSPFNFQSQSIRTRKGFVRLPQFVEDTMKNSLLKFAKALRTGMRIKR